MARRTLHYTASCDCGDNDWFYLSTTTPTTLDGAIAIEPLEGGDACAAWFGNDFRHHLPACFACGRSYALVPVHEWLDADQYEHALHTIRHGRWNGRPAPPPASSGDASVRADIHASTGAPTFAWAIEHSETRILLPRTRPTMTEQTALLNLVTRYGVSAAAVLTGLQPSPAGRLDEAIATTIDTLR